MLQLQRGVLFATYAIQVDTLAAVMVVRAEIDQLFDAIPTIDKKVLSVVAFRNGVRSEAQYVRSADPKETGGTGITDTMTLVIAMQNGVLVDFEWYSFGCGGCSSSNCLQTQYDQYIQQYPMDNCASESRGWGGRAGLGPRTAACGSNAPTVPCGLCAG